MVLKIRVWDKISEVMNYDVVGIIEYGEVSVVSYISEKAISFSDDSEIVPMLYVGVNDKEGKEIYDKDKVEFIFDGVKKVSEVKFSLLTGASVTFESFEKEYTFNLSELSKDVGRELKVIGNAYEG